MKTLLALILTLIGLDCFSQEAVPVKTYIVDSKDTIFYDPPLNTLVVGPVYVERGTADTIKFTSVQPATLNQVSITFQTLAVTDTIYVDWGEDAVVKVSGITDQVKTSDYATINKTYTIKVYGNLSKLSKFTIVTEATVRGIKSSELRKCVNLTYLYLNNLGTTGHTINTADLVGMPLTYLYLNNLGTTGHTINTSDLVGMPLTYLTLSTLGTTTCTGQISDLATGLTTMAIINCGTGISITSGTMKAWANAVITLTPSGTGYTTAQIDGFLNAWATPAGTGTKTIDLRGANQARSSASNTSVSTLTTKGKTILTNP